MLALLELWAGGGGGAGCCSLVGVVVVEAAGVVVAWCWWRVVGAGAGAGRWWGFVLARGVPDVSLTPVPGRRLMDTSVRAGGRGGNSESAGWNGTVVRVRLQHA